MLLTSEGNYDTWRDMDRVSGSEKKLLTTADLADRWGISVDTIIKWRRRNEGPRYVKVVGSIRYREEDLSDYLGRETGRKHDGGES